MFVTDFKDEGNNKFRGPTGADVPQKRRSVMDRAPRSDLSVFYEAAYLCRAKEHELSLKIRIKCLKRT